MIKFDVAKHEYKVFIFVKVMKMSYDFYSV